MAGGSDLNGGQFSTYRVLSCGCTNGFICKSHYLRLLGQFNVGGHTVVSQTKCLTPPPTPKDVLPSDALERKTFPIASGVLDYFPDAIAAISHLSWKGNDQHNPGEPLHWAREKSPDHADTMMRHFMDRGKIDKDGERHTTKAAWRLLAMLQLELENAK